MCFSHVPDLEKIQEEELAALHFRCPACHLAVLRRTGQKTPYRVSVYASRCVCANDTSSNRYRVSIGSSMASYSPTLTPSSQSKPTHRGPSPLGSTPSRYSSSTSASRRCPKLGRPRKSSTRPCCPTFLIQRRRMSFSSTHRTTFTA